MLSSTVDIKKVLTILASRDAAASLAVGGLAGILLQASVGNAAVAGGYRPVAVGTGTDDEGVVLGKGGGDGGKAEKDGGEGELHGVGCGGFPGDRINNDSDYRIKERGRPAV